MHNTQDNDIGDTEELWWISGTKERTLPQIPINYQASLQNYKVTPYNVRADYNCWLECLIQVTLSYILYDEDKYNEFFSSLDKFIEGLKDPRLSNDWQLTAQELQSIENGKKMLGKLKNKEGKLKELDPNLTVLLPFFKLLVARTAEYGLLKVYERFISFKGDEFKAMLLKSIVEKKKDGTYKESVYFKNHDQYKHYTDLQKIMLIPQDINKACKDHCNKVEKYIQELKSTIKTTNKEFLQSIKDNKDKLEQGKTPILDLQNSVSTKPLHLKKTTFYYSKIFPNPKLYAHTIVSSFSQKTPRIRDSNINTLLHLRKNDDVTANHTITSFFFQRFNLYYLSFNIRESKDGDEIVEDGRKKDIDKLLEKKGPKVLCYSRPFGYADHEVYLLLQDKEA